MSRRRAPLSVAAAVLALAAGLLTAIAPAANAQVDGATTVLGGGYGYNGPATAIFLGSTYSVPGRVAVNPTDGSLLIEDGISRVLRVAAGGGNATVFAGTSTSGYAGDGGPATAAQLEHPQGIAVDAAGDVFVAESHHIRRITGGTITTIAGDGSAPDGSTGVAATATGVAPTSIAAFADGRVVFAEGGNVRILGLDGKLTSLAAGGATFGAVASLAVAPDGSAVFVGDSNRHYVYRVVPGGTPTVVAGNGTTGGSTGDGVTATSAPLSAPRGLAVAPNGSVYVTDVDNGRLRRFTVGGTITTVINGAGTSYTCVGAVAMASTGAGAVWCLSNSSSSSQVLHLSATTGAGAVWAGAANGVTASPDGIAATEARIDPVKGIAEDTTGRVWFSGGGLVRYVDSAGQLRTASTPANGPTAPAHLAPAGANAVYAADPVGNKVWRIATDGTRVVVAGNGTTTYGGDGPSATAVGLDAPRAVATAPDGTLYIADSGAGAVRAVDPTSGAITTVLSGATTIRDVAVDADGVVGVTTDANPVEITATGIKSEPGWESYTTLTSDGAGGWYAAFNFAADDIAADGSVHPLVGVYAATMTQLTTAGDGSLLFDQGDTVMRLATPTTGAVSTAPTSFTATPGEGRVTLDWSAPTDGVVITMQPGEATSDNVYDGYGVSNFAPPPVTVFRDRDGLLPIGVDYTYSAFRRTLVSIGPSTVGYAYSVAARATAAALPDTTPPGPVTALTVDAAADTIHLSWTMPTDDDLDPTTPIVVRMATGTTPPASRTDGVAVPVTGSTAAPAAADLAPDTDYSFSIFTVDMRGNSGAPVTTTARLDRTPPGVVTDLVGTPDYMSASATWTNPTDADFAHAIWAIGPGADTPAPPATTCSNPYPDSTSSAAFGGLSMDTDYTIGVWTCDIHGNMSAAAVAHVHTLLDATAPGPVTGVQATGGNHSFTVTFTPPADSDYATTVIRYQAGDVAPATPTDGTGVAFFTNSTTAIAGNSKLPGSTEYAVSLWARDSHGNISTPVTTTVVTLPDTTPPPMPTFTQVTSWASQTVRFCYSMPSPLPSDFAGVYVDVTDGHDPVSYTDGYVSTFPYVNNVWCTTAAVPQNFHTYRLTLWPFDTTGNVGPSVSSDALAQPNASELPSAVSITNAAPTAHDNEIRVAWTAPTSTGGSALTAYRVVVSQGTKTVATKDVGPDVLSTTVGGLPAGVLLSVVVHASNALGWNTVGTAATTMANDTTAPANVTFLAAHARGPGAVRLTWQGSASKDVVQYVVVRTDGGSVPTSPDNGGAIWSGTSTSVTLSGQPMHADHLYTVFARDAVGNTNTGRGVATIATKISMSAPKTAHPGAGFTLSGVLRRWTSGAALGGRTLTLCHRRHGAVTWTCDATTTTAKNGSWHFWRHVWRSTDFQVRYHGYGRLMGSLHTATVTVS